MKRYGNSAAGIMFMIAVFFTLPLQETAEPAINATDVVRLINQDRSLTGAAPLKPNPRLEKAAFEKAADMLKEDYFAHISPAGRQPWDFIKNQSLHYVVAGENLALNYTDVLELQSDLMKSMSHRKNLLSPLFSDVGVAVVPGKFNNQEVVVIVQLFARLQAPEVAADGGQTKPLETVGLNQ